MRLSTNRKHKPFIMMLLSIIISLTLPFSSTIANEINDPKNKTTANTNDVNHHVLKTFSINGTNPYKHILSNVEAEMASRTYSRINSIIRYATLLYACFTFDASCFLFHLKNHEFVKKMQI